MFLSQQVEEIRVRHWSHVPITEYRTTVWKVVFNAGTDRLVWALHANHGPYRNTALARHAIKEHRATIPIIKTPGPSRPVTGREAMKLVGLSHPMAALDFLRDKVTENPDNTTLENWVQPPKEPRRSPLRRHQRHRRCGWNACG